MVTTIKELDCRSYYSTSFGKAVVERRGFKPNFLVIKSVFPPYQEEPGNADLEEEPLFPSALLGEEFGSEVFKLLNFHSLILASPSSEALMVVII